MMIAQELGRRPRPGPGPRPHPPRRRFYRPYYPETTYIYPVYTPGTDNVEDQVNAYAARNECIVIRRGYGPWLVCRIVIDALKGRGWVERAEEAGTILLCPPPASGPSVRGLMVVEPRLRLSWAGNFPQEQFYPSQYVWGLGQATRMIRVIVVDRKNEPGRNVPVVITTPESGNIGEGTTDSDGIFELKIGAGVKQVIPIVTLPEGEMRSVVPIPDQGTVEAVFRSIRRIDGEFLTGFEMAAGGGGLGLAVTGILTRGDVGNLMTGVGTSCIAAAIFSILSRSR